MNTLRTMTFWLVAIGVLLLVVACKDAGGSENEDNVELNCAEGENPKGNGCRLSCKDGWHEGPDSECVVDCPSGTTTDDDGSCVFTCEGDDERYAFNIGTEDEPILFEYCDFGCPGNMVWDEEDGVCEIPCGDGWHEGDDGKCHLDCPEGTIATADGLGCAFEVVGESKECPSEPWDTSIEGPSPLFVDPVYGSEEGDGSQDAPFATIGQAVDAMGDQATVYLAEGVYDEQVIVDGKKEFNLIGQCAANVLIAPTETLEAYPETDDGLTAGAITTWQVDTVRIHGVSVQSPGELGMAVYHDYSAESPRTAQVDQCSMNSSIVTGVTVYGAYEVASVTDTSVTGARSGLSFRLNDETLVAAGAAPTGRVEVERCFIHDLVEVPDVEGNSHGVEVIGADTVHLTDNEIRDFSNAIGARIRRINTFVAEGNLVSNLTGMAGFYLQGAMQEDIPTDMTIRDNVFHTISAGACEGSTYCPIIAFGVFLDAINALSPLHATFEQNRIEQVQGHAVARFPGLSPGGDLSILNSEFVAVSNAVYWMSGDLTIENSRFYRVWRALKEGPLDGYQPLGSLDLKGNSFEDREEDPAGMPESALRSGMTGSFVQVTMSEEPQDIHFSGNVFRNNQRFDSDPTGTAWEVVALSGQTITLEDNLFMANTDGVATTVRSGHVVATNNLYGLNYGGLWTFQEEDTDLISAEFYGNTFYGHLLALDFGWESETGSYSIENNVFLNNNIVTGFYESTGYTAPEVHLTGNYFAFNNLQAGNVHDLLIEDNQFDGCRVIVAGQPEGTLAEIKGNILSRSHIDVFQSDSSVHIENNDINGISYLHYNGTGIAVLESPGPVEIVHNLIRNFSESEAETTAGIGDGIHVVGTPEEGMSEVMIRSNLIEGNGRYGVLLVNAKGRVDGNMYLQNGGGGNADLVVSPPEVTEIRGDDLAFVVTKADAPHTLETEDILDTLR